MTETTLPSHITPNSEGWYHDSVRGKTIHPDQIEAYVARHRYDYMGYSVAPKAVKVKKPKIGPVPKPPAEKPAPVKKAVKAKPKAKKPAKPKAARKRKRRPAKRSI